jgi:protein subunit release factor B
LLSTRNIQVARYVIIYSAAFYRMNVCYEMFGTRPERRVLIMEQYAFDRDTLERDCDLDFFIASGPGGQHRNKVESGVRLVHRPTGIMVTATERRSQHANREVAFLRMADVLRERQRVRVPRKATRPTVASRERRLQAKRQSSATKRLRSLPVRE